MFHILAIVSFYKGPAGGREKRSSADGGKKGHSDTGNQIFLDWIHLADSFLYISCFGSACSLICSRKEAVGLYNSYLGRRVNRGEFGYLCIYYILYNQFNLLFKINIQQLSGASMEFHDNQCSAHEIRSSICCQMKGIEFANGEHA